MNHKRAEPGSPQWCDDCYGRHTQAQRLAVLARCDGLTREEVQAAWSHYWPETDAGRRQLSRDQNALKKARNEAVRFSVARRKEA